MFAGADLRDPAWARVEVRRIVTDSRSVEPGDLFVALVGTSSDGHDHLESALAAGAAALVVERAPERDPGVPVIRTENTRRELARLASAWYGHPGQRLPMIGVTGTLGKTTVLSMLEAILIRSGKRIGTIGSLGVRVGGEAEMTGYTAPDPLILHEALAGIVESGAEMMAMEVTTHALSQYRVHGLRYDQGVFTNLVPLEHVDYHGSFRGYVQAKTRYFDYLRGGAPLVYSFDDRAVRGVVRGRGLRLVGVGEDRGADVRYEIDSMDASGSRFTLRSDGPLPLLAGGELPPFEISIALRALGRSTISNAALSAVSALIAGADEASIPAALAEFPAPRRRMQLLRTEPFLVLDDTAGHPDSMGVVFDVVQRLAKGRVHAAVAIRGKRGAKINRRTAEALAIWAAQTPMDTLVVTSSEGSVDELNQVSPRERTAFLRELEKAGIDHVERPRLDEAIEHLVDRAGPGDLVVLIGAQGMDEGARLLEDRLDGPRRSERAVSSGSGSP
jgi:UDP-N-acetylmuramoyl-L-alanyl-D-glutamate--2,6-diaminopimelate ligase